MSFSIDTTTYPSPNYQRDPNRKVTAIVIHTAEGTLASDMYELRRTNVPMASRKSCHYYVARDGTIYELVKDIYIAWHAGVSHLYGLNNWNDFSIGIEQEHKQGQNYPAIQRSALTWLCKNLISQYKIEERMNVAHRWLAPTRRSDPTDWSDEDLKAWIHGMYAVSVDYAAAWGTAVPYFADSGIAAEWRKHYAQLGAAVTDEYDDRKIRVVQRWFEHGLVTYNPASNLCASFIHM